MKTLFAAAAFAGLLATPALAQDADQSKLLVNPTGLAQHNAYARTNSTNRTLGAPRHRVYSSDGRYLGADPDAVIRDSMYYDSSLTSED